MPGAGAEHDDSSDDEHDPNATSVVASGSEASDGEEEAGSSVTTDVQSMSTAAVEEARPRALLLQSLFKGRPATVWFGYPPFLEMERTEGAERIVELADPRQLPLWFKAERNINCVSQSLKRNGFRRLVKGHTFNVFWGSHLSEKALRRLQPCQYVNHFPGSYGVGRKDYLWKNVSRMQRDFPAEYDFCAKSYVLPGDRDVFEREYREGEVFIVKPPASAEGRGIRLMRGMDQAPARDKAAVVQKYITRPYLIDGKKFDLRVYVAVTSFDPLRVYVYEEGLGRFATADYPHPSGASSKAGLKNRLAHLTNYSLNKRSDAFVRNTDAERDGEGSKWSLSAVLRHLAAEGHDVAALRRRIEAIATKTMIAVEPSVVGKLNQCGIGRGTCFELFGLDVLLDEAARPWLIEVNVACSLSSSSPLDKRVKHALMTDLLHLVGIVPLERDRPAKHGLGTDAVPGSESVGTGGAPPGRRGAGRRAAPGPPTAADTRRAKGRNIFELRATPLADLGPYDWELIMDAEDEHARRGRWVRAFPCDWARMAPLLALFPIARYRNTVLAKWHADKDWSLLAPRLGFPPPEPLALALNPQPPRRGSWSTRQVTAADACGTAGGPVVASSAAAAAAGPGGGGAHTAARSTARRASTPTGIAEAGRRPAAHIAMDAGPTSGEVWHRAGGRPWPTVAAAGRRRPSTGDAPTMATVGRAPSTPPTFRHMGSRQEPSAPAHPTPLHTVRASPRPACAHALAGRPHGAHVDPGGGTNVARAVHLSTGQGALAPHLAGTRMTARERLASNARAALLAEHAAVHGGDRGLAVVNGSRGGAAGPPYAAMGRRGAGGGERGLDDLGHGLVGSAPVWSAAVMGAAGRTPGRHGKVAPPSIRPCKYPLQW